MLGFWLMLINMLIKKCNFKFCSPTIISYVAIICLFLFSGSSYFLCKFSRRMMVDSGPKQLLSHLTIICSFSGLPKTWFISCGNAHWQP